MTPLISVVIVNYNGGAFLQEAVNALSRQTLKDFELIVFDNASSDGSADALDLTGLAEARLIRHSDNIGFAAGNNRAAEAARGTWLALLNPDTVAAPDWLEKLIAASQAYPDCRNFASAQINLNNPDLLDGAGDAYLIFGFPWRGGFGRPASELPPSGWVFSACGAAAMYDRELFLSMGGFDERFFCYCEDVDLGFRLQLAGYDCRFVSEAVVRHAGSGITGHRSAFSTYYGTRNRIWTYSKNMPPAVLVATFPVHVLLTLYIVARNTFTPRFWPMVHGLKDGMIGIADKRRPSPWKLLNQGFFNPNLSGRMAWNPWRMSSSKTHIRKLVE